MWKYKEGFEHTGQFYVNEQLTKGPSKAADVYGPRSSQFTFLLDQEEEKFKYFKKDSTNQYISNKQPASEQQLNA